MCGYDTCNVYHFACDITKILQSFSPPSTPSFIPYLLRPSATESHITLHREFSRHCSTKWRTVNVNIVWTNRGPVHIVYEYVRMYECVCVPMYLYCGLVKYWLCKQPPLLRNDTVNTALLLSAVTQNRDNAYECKCPDILVNMYICIFTTTHYDYNIHQMTDSFSWQCGSPKWQNDKVRSYENLYLQSYHKSLKGLDRLTASREVAFTWLACLPCEVYRGLRTNLCSLYYIHSNITFTDIWFLVIEPKEGLYLFITSS
jgi:hypothetical protein